LYDTKHQYLKLFEKYKPSGVYDALAKNTANNKILNKKETDATNAFITAAKLDAYLSGIYNVDKETHNLHPNEVRSDIYQLRQDLYRAGIFDARSQDFNKEHLEQARKVYGKKAILNRLFKAYSDEDLIDLMNSVVENKPKQDETKINYAKAGNIIKYQSGSKLTSKLNPYNWGVPDYSRLGKFSLAYKTAKKDGLKEFMWNNERYTTEYAGSPRQEVG